MRLVRYPPYLAVALCHFAVDLLNGQTGILLAVLSVPLALKNSDIGLIATTYSVVGALSQPVFGWLSDRHGSRWLTAGGVLWMASFFALVPLIPGRAALVFLVFAALGSAAFHPPGTMKATQVGQWLWAGQAATAASIFFLFGQFGLSLGPAIGGALLDTLGLSGLLILAALALPIGLFAAWQLRPLPHPAANAAASAHHTASAPAPSAQADWLPFILVMLIAGLRTWAQMTTTTFAPKYFHDLGVSATLYGAIVALFMAGSAIGGVVGGLLADRWGQRRIISLTLALAIAPYFFFPFAHGAFIYLMALLAGLLNGAPHSILVTMAQRLLPGKAATASGIILGFMFTAGALGTYLSGLTADRLGLGRVLQANALLSLAALLVSLALLWQGRAAQTVTAAAD